MEMINPMSFTKTKNTKHNITYAQAGVLCLVGQKITIFEIQFFVDGEVFVIPAWRIAEER